MRGAEPWSDNAVVAIVATTGADEPAAIGENSVPSIGLDDGFALTKVALPDGRLLAIPSQARTGRARVTSLNGSKVQVFDYETDAIPYAAGAVDGEPTEFDAYPFSGLNRVIVQHALQSAGLGGASVQAVSGLPVRRFYSDSGERRSEIAAKKRHSLCQPVRPLDGRAPAAIAFHEVIPEALAAWYDDVIVESDQGVQLDDKRLAQPVAVIDIGGRTTDIVVVSGQAVQHTASGTLQCGLLDVHRDVSEGIRARFALETLSTKTLLEAVHTGSVRLYGKSYDVTELVQDSQQQVVARVHAATARLLGQGAELERIVFVGGGTVVLADRLRDWFTNQHIAPHPTFANARGMRKYLMYVCETNETNKKT